MYKRKKSSPVQTNYGKKRKENIASNLQYLLYPKTIINKYSKVNAIQFPNI